MLARLRRTLALTSMVLAVAAGTLAPAYADNVVTPGDFTGYGFDQCLTPTQQKMTTWMETSPFSAVGIYISGDSRACRDQPNLTPDWVTTQLAAGWRLLPITLGPQASCTTRDRYLKQVRINPDPTNAYAKAKTQGAAEADKTVRAATALGIAAGSTLWYDIEAFNIAPTDCRESALTFLSSWTDQLHKLGFVSGIYSSAASGIKILDDARALRPGRYTMPDQLWIADWNGKADVYSTYIRSDGWMPHKRVHQYRGGHNETYGGVTINIDSNWLDVGLGSRVGKEPAHCGSVSYNLSQWPTLRPGVSGSAGVKALQCMLKNRGLFAGTVTGTYDTATIKAARTYQARQKLSLSDTWTTRHWLAILTQGAKPVAKIGTADTAVRRLQRALTAAGAGPVSVTGVVDKATVEAIKAYQNATRLPAYGVAGTTTWQGLASGRTG